MRTMAITILTATLTKGAVSAGDTSSGPSTKFAMCGMDPTVDDKNGDTLSHIVIMVEVIQRPRYFIQSIQSPCWIPLIIMRMNCLVLGEKICKKNE